MPDIVSTMEEAPQWLKQVRTALVSARNRQVEEDNCFEVISLEEVPENYASFLSKDEEELIFHSAGPNKRDKGVSDRMTTNQPAYSKCFEFWRRRLQQWGDEYSCCEPFFCGYIRIKKPDISIWKEYEDPAPEIVGEVEYAHLNLAGLLEESFFLLTEYTTPRYCVAVKIFPHQLEFRCIIFVLERLEDNAFDPHKRAMIKILN